MSEEYDKAMHALEFGIADCINLKLDIIRRHALYPDLASMENRTWTIAKAQAALSTSEVDPEKMHLIYHIDMLKKELLKFSSNSSK